MAYALPGPSGLSRSNRYRDLYRNLYGRTVRSARDYGGRFMSSARGFDARLRSAGQSESLGGVVASQVGTGGAALALGTVDASPLGERISDLTGGVIKASTGLTLLGIGLRALRVDTRYSRTATRVNSAVIKAMIPVWMYQAGTRIPGAVSSRFGGGPAQISGVQSAPALAGAGVPAKEQPEPIPGEATIA